MANDTFYYISYYEEKQGTMECDLEKHVPTDDLEFVLETIRKFFNEHENVVDALEICERLDPSISYFFNSCENGKDYSLIIHTLTKKSV